MRDDAFWELGMAPKKKPTDTRPRAYDVTAVEITADAPGADRAPENKIPARPFTPAAAQPHTAELPPAPAQSPAPTRSSVPSARPMQNAERFTEITDAPSNKTNAENSKPVPEKQPTVEKPSYPDTSLRRYRPRSGMIREVEIFPWPSSYGFYAQFRRDAARFFGLKGKPCSRAPYFSYIPQYAQLSSAQMDYYLYFRELVRAHRYPPVDFSYVLLYIYEILNLPDRIPPREGMVLLCEIWLAYRETHPKLDKYMAEWICDFGLTYGLPCPAARLASIKDICLENCSLREYYIAEDDLAVVLAEYGSYHTFRKTKYAKGEYAPLFEKYVPMALAYTIDAAARDGVNGFSFEDMRLYRAERDVFCGALCSHAVKRRVVVSYLSLGRSHEMRETVTSVVKYIENGIRAHVKIRSMLSVGNLAPELKAYVDEFMQKTFGVSNVSVRRRQEKVREEYEKLYDVPESTLSPERARQIEQESWASTDVLTSAFSDADVIETIIENTPTPVVPTPEAVTPVAPISTLSPAEVSENESPYAQLFAALTDGERQVLVACLDGADVNATCRRMGLLADSVVSCINEKAADWTGDIVMEADGIGYRVIEDYKEELDACRP
ncbi:MAG: TerB N-terminal domain-containing protein [Clostridia bacterium]|nr:TerB N-terminal domain-containing protein [Clostridia bacterium]